MSGDGFHQIRSKNTQIYWMYNSFWRKTSLLPKILQIHYSKPPIFVDKMVKQLCNTQKVRHTELYYRHTRISNIKPYAIHVYIREQAKKMRISGILIKKILRISGILAKKILR